MSDEYRDELTSQSEASAEEQQTQEADLGQSDQTGTRIPEKFVGKSLDDIMQAYQELEKDRGRLASEVGETRKKMEELEEQYRHTQFNQQPAPSTPQQEVQPQQQMDPLSVLDSKFDEDPRAAIKEALKQQYEMLQSQSQMQRVQEQSVKAQEYYYSQKKDNPDFARRESSMQNLARQYAHMVKPEYLNSPDMIKMLDLASQGADRNYYEKAALKSAQEQGASVREEKRKASSVSSNSEGDSRINLNDLSNDEYLKAMEKLYGFKDE
jgi:hypothetical protein